VPLNDTKLIIGGIKFCWLAVWDQISDWLSGKLEVFYFFQTLCEAAALGGGECGPCPDFALYTLAFALQLVKNHGITSVRLTEM